MFRGQRDSDGLLRHIAVAYARERLSLRHSFLLLDERLSCQVTVLLTVDNLGLLLVINRDVSPHRLLIDLELNLCLLGSRKGSILADSFLVKVGDFLISCLFSHLLLKVQSLLLL